MKAKEVLKILNIARTTLYNYTKEGKIKVTQLDNGYYDEDSVYKLIKKINELMLFMLEYLLINKK